MYIKDQYKDQYFEYLENTSYSRGTIRSIRSDIGLFFRWIRSIDIDNHSIEEITSSYDTFLLSYSKNENVLARRRSSYKKFVSWLNNNNLVSSNDVALDRSSSPKSESSTYVTPHKTVSMPTYIAFLVFLLSVSLFLSYIYVYRINNAPISLSGSQESVLQDGSMILQGTLTDKHTLDLLSKGREAQVELIATAETNSMKKVVRSICPLEYALVEQNKNTFRYPLSRCQNYSDLEQIVRTNKYVVFDLYSGKKLLASTSYSSNKASTVSKGNIGNHNNPNPGADEAVSQSLSVLKSDVSDDFLPQKMLISEFVLSLPRLDYPDGIAIGIEASNIVYASASSNLYGFVSGTTIISSGICTALLDTTSDPLQVGDRLTISTDNPGYLVKANNTNDSIGYVIDVNRPDSSVIRVLIK